MSKVYLTRCIVKKDGKQYPQGAVIEGLTEKEIQQGLAQNWLTEVGNGEGPTETKGKITKARKALLKQAEELGIAVAEEMTDEEIQQKIDEALK